MLGEGANAAAPESKQKRTIAIRRSMLEKCSIKSEILREGKLG